MATIIRVLDELASVDVCLHGISSSEMVRHPVLFTFKEDGQQNQNAGHGVANAEAKAYQIGARGWCG